MKKLLILFTSSLITCYSTWVICGQNKIVDSPFDPNAIVPSASAQYIATGKVDEPVLKQLLGRWQRLIPASPYRDHYLNSDYMFASGGRFYSLSWRGKAIESRYRIDTSVNPYIVTITGCNSLDRCTDTVANFKLDSDTRMTLTIEGKSIVLERVSRNSQLPSGVEVLKVTDGTIRASESFAKASLGVISRSQQAFHLEKSRFSNNIDELQSYLGSSIERDKNYVYKILEFNSGRGVQILLMANHRKLRNYTGFIYMLSDSSMVVICQSNKPSSVVPKFKFPSNNSNEVQCPSGYSRTK